MNGIPIFPKESDLKGDHTNGYNNNNINYPSSSNFADFRPQSHSPFTPNQAQQQMHAMNHANQWPQTNHQNAQPHPQQTQHQRPHQSVQTPQQHFNPSHWNLPMHPPSFPNGMVGMNGMNLMGLGLPPFNMPMFPQQFLHDALALSAPVVTADETLLLETLIRHQAQGDNYKDALNSLHGKNGHSASLWKDYYLEHKDRIDQIILKRSNPKEKEKQQDDLKDLKSVVKSVKKPVIKLEPSPDPSSATWKHGRSSHKPRRQSSPPPRKPLASSSRTPSESVTKGGRRRTINSLTVDAPSYSREMPPSNAEIQIPEPPSRSPTPPTKVVPHSRGNKFTEEDSGFFIKYMSWKLKNDSDLSRNDLCELLAEKAPHHSSQSWYSYWSNHHDLPDKILAAAHGEEEGGSGEGSGDASSEEECDTVRRRPKYKEPSSDEDEESQATEEDEESDVDGDSQIPSFDENAMGQPGTSFTKADLAIVARYVSTFDDWSAATNATKWGAFAGKYAQRTAKAWAEYFRRNERAITKLSKRIRKQGITTSSPRGRLSFDNGPPRTKRKFVPEEDSISEPESKASRTS
ncbi:hypothetical protein E1B28_000900 [Marasmius oreades]|uniref:Uncharacterized protein n=1 Tax=Marasmius oreades TaxID=181124 RepID=A0A9P7V2G3_9AGAR|nr:uncharacterized protein E1B28_000900 [Marasmius oreades]KAG7099017.1 hypothetical protein E1B28_000900 [Marasmius oreades]